MIVQHTSLINENPKNLVHRVQLIRGCLTSTLNIEDKHYCTHTPTLIINSVVLKVPKSLLYMLAAISVSSRGENGSTLLSAEV